MAVTALLAACGGAGNGGAGAPKTSTPPTTAPIVAGTDAPKNYPVKTADPSQTPVDYYGY